MILTADGTYTLYSKRYDEAYHCVKEGALKETLYKHVYPAFRHCNKDNINILDICFGLGFNTLATIHYLTNMGIKANIYSPELDAQLIDSLKSFTYPKEFKPLKGIINSLSSNFSYKDDFCDIKIYIGDAVDFLNSTDIKFDIIYQDPFSFSKNSSLWNLQYFEKLFEICDKDAILTTYSQAKHIRENMLEVGFCVYESKNSSFGVRNSTICFKEHNKVDLTNLIKIG